jgi:hypothetical protein
MNIRITMLIAALILPCQGEAWIGYGFKSGMSRFDVTRYLYEKEGFEITEDDQHTVAATGDGEIIYKLVYCSTPQKLYLMKFRLFDSPAVFMKTLEKYGKRYGEPEGLDDVPDYRESDNWEDVDVSLIWDLNESETILLTHGSNGTITEFQDISICQ